MNNTSKGAAEGFRGLECLGKSVDFRYLWLL